METCVFIVLLIFAYRSDLLILKTIKQSVEMRNSVCHSATIYANAIMHAGTTVDTFLRENLVIIFFLLPAYFLIWIDLQLYIVSTGNLVFPMSGLAKPCNKLG